jgi:hypothetical protein
VENILVGISKRADAREVTTISSDVGGESEARENALLRLRKSSQYSLCRHDRA